MNFFIGRYDQTSTPPSPPTMWPRVNRIRRTTEVFYTADGPAPGNSNFMLLPTTSPPYFLHLGTAGTLFVDGHCESIQSKAFIPPGASWSFMMWPWHANAVDPQYYGRTDY
jgi:prepilin-type processing-associated H-X9-DG protein